jgi:hypothetical protein
MGLDEVDEIEVLDKLKKDVEPINKKLPKKDSNPFSLKKSIEGILPDEKRKGTVKDTVKKF